MGISLIVAWSIALGFMILFFLIAVLQANSVPFQPGCGDITKRRVIFWVWCVLTPLISFGVNAIVAGQIEVPAHRNMYLTASGIAAGVALVVFVLVGAIIGFSARGKLRRWPF